MASDGLGHDEDPGGHGDGHGDPQRGDLDGDRRGDRGSGVAERRQLLDVHPDRAEGRRDLLGDGVDACRVGADHGDRLDVGDLVTMGPGEAFREEDRRESVIGDVGLVADHGHHLDLDHRALE